MDGENNGKPYEQMDDLGGFPLFLETPMYRLSCIYPIIEGTDRHLLRWKRRRTI